MIEQHPALDYSLDKPQMDEGTNMIQLLAHLAQQIQLDLKPDEGSLGYIRQALLKGGNDADLIRATIKSLDVPQLERLLRRGQGGGGALSPGSIPPSIPVKTI
ncbi:MAG: hypothetical protein RMM98_18175, partial [Acidobacteriota bacterium]|nr:hypothetical protein [Blastocatellia bacterium]MDW8241533.1 hypothetical protein [Acidobacteriota bacterium]